MYCILFNWTIFNDNKSTDAQLVLYFYSNYSSNCTTIYRAVLLYLFHHSSLLLESEMILLQHYERYFWYYASNNFLMIQMNIYFSDISLLCSSDKNETFYNLKTTI